MIYIPRRGVVTAYYTQGLRRSHWHVGVQGFASVQTTYEPTHWMPKPSAPTSEETRP